MDIQQTNIIKRPQNIIAKTTSQTYQVKCS